MHVITCMDKEKNMCNEIRELIEENIILREQKAILSCFLLFVTAAWLKEKIIKAAKEKKQQKGD